MKKRLVLSIAFWPVIVLAACSDAQTHPPLLGDCPACNTNPLVTMSTPDSSTADVATNDGNPTDDANDASLDTADGE